MIADPIPDFEEKDKVSIVLLLEMMKSDLWDHSKGSTQDCHITNTSPMKIHILQFCAKPLIIL